MTQKNPLSLGWRVYLILGGFVQMLDSIQVSYLMFLSVVSWYSVTNMKHRLPSKVENIYFFICISAALSMSISIAFTAIFDIVRINGSRHLLFGTMTIAAFCRSYPDLWRLNKVVQILIKRNTELQSHIPGYRISAGRHERSNLGSRKGIDDLIRSGKESKSNNIPREPLTNPDIKPAPFGIPPYISPNISHRQHPSDHDMRMGVMHHTPLSGGFRVRNLSLVDINASANYSPRICVNKTGSLGKLSAISRTPQSLKADDGKQNLIALMDSSRVPTSAKHSQNTKVQPNDIKISLPPVTPRLADDESHPQNVLKTENEKDAVQTEDEKEAKVEKTASCDDSDIMISKATSQAPTVSQGVNPLPLLLALAPSQAAETPQRMSSSTQCGTEDEPRLPVDLGKMGIHRPAPKHQRRRRQSFTGVARIRSPSLDGKNQRRRERRHSLTKRVRRASFQLDILYPRNHEMEKHRLSSMHVEKQPSIHNRERRRSSRRTVDVKVESLLARRNREGRGGWKPSRQDGRHTQSRNQSLMCVPKRKPGQGEQEGRKKGGHKNKDLYEAFRMLLIRIPFLAVFGSLMLLFFGVSQMISGGKYSDTFHEEEFILTEEIALWAQHIWTAFVISFVRCKLPFCTPFWSVFSGTSRRLSHMTHQSSQHGVCEHSKH
ncbi:hypothetical protein AAMO2058_000536700 [Amorphochlora amoebiformis]